LFPPFAFLYQLGPYSCLSHVVNLGNIAVVSRITKIAAVETTTAIWEYDPTLPDNHLLNGSLDVIAAIRTLAIKVCNKYHQSHLPSLITSHLQQIQSSGQRIEVFNKLQIECNFAKPYKIPLHSNVRWGTAYCMLERAFKLREVCNPFSSGFVPL
jgi:hypothetical protein